MAGRGRVGRRSANFLPATRPRGLRGALVFAPRPGARWRKVEARGGARGTQRLRVAGPRGREGVDPACPGRTASHGPPQRPLPASAVRAEKDLCLPPAARSPGGLYTSLTTWSHQPPHPPPASPGRPADLPTLTCTLLGPSGRSGPAEAFSFKAAVSSGAAGPLGWSRAEVPNNWPLGSRRGEAAGAVQASAGLAESPRDLAWPRRGPRQPRAPAPAGPAGAGVPGRRQH